jgi:hypothetical protein
MVWVQEDKERNYSWPEYGKNVLVFGGGGDVENSLAMLIQESERLSNGCRRQRRGKIVWYCLILPNIATRKADS